MELDPLNQKQEDIDLKIWIFPDLPFQILWYG